MANSIDGEIVKYLPLLGYEEKRSLLSVIRSFLHISNDTAEFDLAQYNRDIEEALLDVSNGKVISQSELNREMQEW